MSEPTPDGNWTLVVAMLSRVDASITALRTDVTTRFDSLGERFVPRPEINARFEESARDRAQLNTQVASLNEQLAQQQRQRVLDRRATVGTVLAAVAGVAAYVPFFYK